MLGETKGEVVCPYQVFRSVFAALMAQEVRSVIVFVLGLGL